MTDQATIRQELERLEVNGRLTPEQVVEAARDETSPLHTLFEWDDEKASHKYRLDQARSLIRSVRVEVRVDSRVVRAIGYIHDPGAGPRQQGYVRITNVTSDQMAREAVMAELVRAQAALERARGIADVLDLTAELESLIEEITLLGRKLAA